MIDEFLDTLYTRNIDAVPAWEPACRDRKKRGTTSGACRVLARLNHACDLLADLAAATGRKHDLDFHQTFQKPPDASNYFTLGDAPLLNDLYVKVGRCASAILYEAVLQHDLVRFQKTGNIVPGF